MPATLDSLVADKVRCFIQHAWPLFLPERTKCVQDFIVECKAAENGIVFQEISLFSLILWSLKRSIHFCCTLSFLSLYAIFFFFSFFIVLKPHSSPGSLFPLLFSVNRHFSDQRCEAAFVLCVIDCVHACLKVNLKEKDASYFLCSFG